MSYLLISACVVIAATLIAVELVSDQEDDE